jgi:hypothetical protein
MKKKEYLTSTLIMGSTLVGFIIIGLFNLLIHQNTSYSVTTGGEKEYINYEVGYVFDYEDYYLKSEMNGQVKIYNETTTILMGSGENLLAIDESNESISEAEQYVMIYDSYEVEITSWHRNYPQYNDFNYYMLFTFHKDDLSYEIFVQSIDSISYQDFIQRVRWI